MVRKLRPKEVTRCVGILQLRWSQDLAEGPSDCKVQALFTMVHPLASQLFHALTGLPSLPTKGFHCCALPQFVLGMPSFLLLYLCIPSCP